MHAFIIDLGIGFALLIGILTGSYLTMLTINMVRLIMGKPDITLDDFDLFH